MESNIKNLSSYLYRRCGGEVKHGAEKFIDLADGHKGVELDESMADWWLLHMHSALIDVRFDIRDEHRQQLYNFMRYTAYMLIVSGRYRRQHMQQNAFF